MDSTGNPIEAVRARLDGGRKWAKGAEVDGLGGRCLLAAATNDVMQVAHTLAPIIREQFPDRAPQRGDAGTVVTFNDHPLTDFTDVEKVLVEGIARWDAQVSS